MSLQPQPHDRGDLDHGQVVDLALLVPGRDPAELLELVDGALHPVALAVGGPVKARLPRLVRLARNHRPDATTPQVAAHARVAVALVTRHRAGADPRPAPPLALDRAGLHQPAQHRCLVALPGAGQDHHWPAAALHPQVQLGGVAAAAAPQRLPIALLVRICASPLCPGRRGRRWPAGGAPRRRAGGPAPPSRPRSEAASPARRGRPRRPATWPAPGPTRPGAATGRTGWPLSPRGRTRWAGRATARRCGPATRSPRRPAGGPWAAGPSAAAGVVAAAPAWPTARRRAPARFVPWARTLPTCPTNIANT